MEYQTIKQLHITCVGLSVILFVLRGIWMLRNTEMLSQCWVKTLPHVIDTALLISALSLAIVSGQYPIEQNWLSAKLVGLLAYIVLGSFALKRGKTRRSRTAAFIAALVLFTYIVSVAISKQVLVFW